MKTTYRILAAAVAIGLVAGQTAVGAAYSGTVENEVKEWTDPTFWGGLATDPYPGKGDVAGDGSAGVDTVDLTFLRTGGSNYNLDIDSDVLAADNGAASLDIDALTLNVNIVDFTNHRNSIFTLAGFFCGNVRRNRKC